MSTDRQFYVDNAWRWKCGLPELDKPQPMPNIEELYKTQWCDKYEKLRRNRMVMGTFRYGDYKTSNVRYDRIQSAIDRLKKYQETGNTEFLVDVGNLCMIEFDKPFHPNAHFESVDDGTHVEIIK